MKDTDRTQLIAYEVVLVVFIFFFLLPETASRIAMPTLINARYTDTPTNRQTDKTCIKT